MSNSLLFVIGAGGAGKDVAAALLANGKHIQFVDDVVSGEVIQLPVFGTIPDFVTANGGPFVIGVGNCSVRKLLWEQLQTFRPYTFISHHALVMLPDLFAIGAGSIIMPQTRVTANAQIGFNSLIHYGCHISHDSSIGNHCVLMPNVMITSGATIEDEVYIGANVVISEKVTIPKGSIIPPNSHICS